jgi:tetratricopeptide (TPR) repeat protein
VLRSQTSALSLTMSIGSWLAVLLFAWLLWKRCRRDEHVVLALAWLLLFLLPLVNLIPIGNTPVAQHYLIIPSIGLAWLVARAAAALAPTPLAAAVVAGLLLAWQPAFRQSVHAYASTTSLYETTLANYPNNIEARVNLIAAYENTAQLDKARTLLDSSLQLAPDHPGLLKNQLSMLFREQRFPDALAVLDRHPETVSADPELNLRRALVLKQLGREREAEPIFQRIFSEPTAPELHLVAGFQLANIWAQTRRFQEAQTLLRRLHAEFPDNQDVSITLQLIDAALAP